MEIGEKNNVILIEHLISFYNIGKYQVRASFAGHASVPLDPLYFLLAIHLSLSLFPSPQEEIEDQINPLI